MGQVVGDSKMSSSGVYMWRCIPEDKCYIGRAVDLERRKRQFLNFNYRYSTKTDKLSGVDITRKEYPNESYWYYEILKECDRNELNYWEKYYISLFKSNETGYNQTRGGTTGTDGYKHTEATRNKIAEKQRAAAKRYSPQERVEKAKYASTFVDRDNPEYRHKLSEALMGHTETQETRDKIRKSQEKNFKPVVRIDGNNVPQYFVCIMDAVRSIMKEDSKAEKNRCKAAVRNCLCNKSRTKTARGYKFLYV